MDNFQLYHQNKFNIIAHIATTSSAFISIFSMVSLNIKKSINFHTE